jgi:hypothetical protein
VFVAGKREVTAAKTGRSLSPEAKLILRIWFAENFTRYPSTEEKLNLAQEAGLNIRQVSPKLRSLALQKLVQASKYPTRKI